MTAYATRDDLATFGLLADQLADVPTEVQDKALEAASRRFDSYLNAARGTLPLVTWGEDLREAVAVIAAYNLLTTQIGFNPEPNSPDYSIVQRYDRTIAWARDIARGNALLSGGATTPAPAAMALVSSDPPRGYRRGRRSRFNDND